MSRGQLELIVNGAATRVDVAGGERLIDVLRGPLGLSGCREGCGNGECGACTVLLDGRVVNACLVLAAEVAGRAVTTVEGLLGPGGELHPVQRAFVDHGAVQCGFCTPGMIMSAVALLDANPSPSDAEIRDALLGNLCRCTGYVQIIAAVRAAAEARHG